MIKDVISFKIIGNQFSPFLLYTCPRSEGEGCSIVYLTP